MSTDEGGRINNSIHHCRGELESVFISAPKRRVSEVVETASYESLLSPLPFVLDIPFEKAALYSFFVLLLSNLDEDLLRHRRIKQV